MLSFLAHTASGDLSANAAGCVSKLETLTHSSFEEDELERQSALLSFKQALGHGGDQLLNCEVYTNCVILIYLRTIWASLPFAGYSIRR